MPNKVTIIEDPNKGHHKSHAMDNAHLTPGNAGNRTRKASSISQYDQSHTK